MNYKIQILSKAADDIRIAAKWYEKEQLGLGKRFAKNVKQEVKIIKQNPFAFAVKYQNVRTVLVNKFPYLIHFKIDKIKKEVHIFAVFHTSRNANKWE